MPENGGGGGGGAVREGLLPQKALGGVQGQHPR